MAELWQFLSGEVPGGFTLLVVLLIFFFPILEYIYRTGETMSRRVYLRWRWMGPLLIVVIYALLWVQTPPKTAPKRVAVILSENGTSDWREYGLQDLIRRQLQNSLQSVVVNPWHGSRGGYKQPDQDALSQAGYAVYSLTFNQPKAASTFSATVLREESEIARWSGDGRQLLTAASKLSSEIISDLGLENKVKSPFDRDVPLGTLQNYYTGVIALGKSQPNAARQYFENALSADSTLLQSEIWYGISLEASGEMSEAAMQFIAAMQSPSANSEIMLMAGEFFLRIKEWEKAEPPLKLALTRNPLCIRAYYGLAQLHPERLGDLKLNTRELLLNEAIRLDPAFEEARLKLIDEASKVEGSDHACSIASAGLKINPESIPLKLKLGAMELYSGRAEKAKEAYESIFTIDPQNAAAAFNIGVVEYRTDHKQEAEEYFKKSIDYGGGIDNYYYLGLIYQDLKQPDKAIESFEKRWEMRKSDEDPYAIKAKEYAETLKRSMEKNPQ